MRVRVEGSALAPKRRQSGCDTGVQVVSARKAAVLANKARSLSHTKWMCECHIVLAPKYRRKLIYSQYRDSLGEIFCNLCRCKGVEIIEGHLMHDRVHMPVGTPPKISVPGFMGYLKGKSALVMFDKPPTSSTSSATGTSGPRATTCRPSG